MKKTKFFSILFIVGCVLFIFVPRLFSNFQYLPSLRFDKKKSVTRKHLTLMDKIFGLRNRPAKNRVPPPVTHQRKKKAIAIKKAPIPKPLPAIPEFPATDTYPHLPPALKRSAQIRARIHSEQRDWKDAETELDQLHSRYPRDRWLNLDRANVLEKIGRWQEAHKIYDDVWEDTRARKFERERAYENRLTLRKKYGGLIEWTYQGSGLSDEVIRLGEIKIRSFINPRTAVTLTGRVGEFVDRENALNTVIADRSDRVGLSLFHQINSAWDISMFIRKNARHLKNSENAGVTTSLEVGNGTQIELSYEKNALWYEPVDAFAFQGLFDRTSGSFFHPFMKKWFVNGDLQYTEYRIHRNQFLGREYEGNLFIGREVFRTPYGHHNPLRYASLSLGYSRSKSDQDNSTVSQVDLLDKSNVFTLNGYTHFLFGARAHLNLSGYIGEDNIRKLRIKNADLYGLEADFNVDINSTMSVFTRANYTSESGSQQQGGIDKKLTAGIRLFF